MVGNQLGSGLIFTWLAIVVLFIMFIKGSDEDDPLT